ncbi:hypothetical protein [Xylella fastidiosa]
MADGVGSLAGGAGQWSDGPGPLE